MIERWDPAKHRELVDGWIRARNEVGTIDDFCSALPPTGFVSHQIAVGFLYRTDAPMAYVGSIYSDPASTKDARGVALSNLLYALANEAYALGYDILAGSPSVPSLVERFKQHGFSVQHGCSFAVGRLRR